MPGRDNRIVYSTDPQPARHGSGPAAPQPASPPPREQTARIWRERKGRGGKTVTVVSGLQLTGPELAALAKQLKALCGSGGTVKEGDIEIQGDHRQRIAAELKKLGYQTRLVGG